MKKSTLFLGALLSSGFAFSQIGVNTDQPKATFDIMASPSDAAKTDGFIAPRLKGSELKAKDALYAGSQTGAIVYITEALLPADITVKTTNVTDVGYFYFDGTIWQRIGNGTTLSTEPWNIQGTTNPSTDNTQNIYQTGSVAVGKNSVYANGVNPVMLDVEGALRSGTGHTGVVGANSVAIGTDNTASGNQSIALGSGTTASGDRSMALGIGGEASGKYATAMGLSSNASGETSTAMGSITTASGYASTAMGEYTTASNNFATATGENTTANGIASTAAGRSTVASSMNEFVVGQLNAITTGNPNQALGTDAVFQIGNGDFNTNVSNNAMTVLKSGKTGIAITGLEATAKPTEFLDLGTGTARVRNLPVNGAANAIYTQGNGTASATQNQTFTATKTVVADANGVLGYIDGLPGTNPSGVQNLTYARKTVSPINATTPTDSQVSIGNITFRFNGTSFSGANIEYKVSQSNHVTILYHKGGSGGTNLEEWGRQASVAGTWYSFTGEVGNATKDINPGNRDIAYAIITLHNTKDVYRVTANTNGDITASGSVPAVASSITLFVEKLQ
ncbi:hypothetical protein [Chryseobacterium joostei]|uniref:hypothetical protein n=1 Tax=Chryseobacterium joostei TaxID=112234 RepID=UPI003D0C5CA7